MKRFLMAVLLGFAFTSANAADVVEQRYIDQLSKGGIISIKQAAQSIYNTGKTSQEVIDVAAEVLLTRYPTAANSDIDTLSWLCKAIGRSGNSRYYSALREVYKSRAHRKLRKYAKVAIKQVGKSTENQYQKGMVSLAALRADKPQAIAKAAPKPAVTAQPQGQASNQSLEVVVVGMSMQEVYDLVGVPTATTTQQTGKAYNPFHFSKKDIVRTIALYKGKGRIIFSHDGYSSVSRVLEVMLDPQETGYP